MAACQAGEALGGIRSAQVITVPHKSEPERVVVILKSFLFPNTYMHYMHIHMFSLLIYSTYGANFVILISFHFSCHMVM